MSQNTAIKFDHDKNPLELLPHDALWLVAWVLLVGKVKYDADNWAKGMSWRRMTGSLKRHITEFEAGVDDDAETGLLNLAHATCCNLFLLAYQIRQVGIDDRVKVKLPKLPEKTVKLIEDLRRAKVAKQARADRQAARRAKLPRKAAARPAPKRLQSVRRSTSRVS